MTKKIRVFYAHSAGASDSAIAQGVADVRAYIIGQWKTAGNEAEIKCSVVPGRDDFHRYFNGDWDEWTAGVSKRGNATTGEKLYHIVVVPEVDVGRATAQIIQRAMSVGMPVFLFAEGSLVRIAQVKMTDPEDWQSGYQLELPLPDRSIGEQT